MKSWLTMSSLFNKEDEDKLLPPEHCADQYVCLSSGGGAGRVLGALFCQDGSLCPYPGELQSQADLSYQDTACVGDGVRSLGTEDSREDLLGGCLTTKGGLDDKPSSSKATCHQRRVPLLLILLVSMEA